MNLELIKFPPRENSSVVGGLLRTFLWLLKNIGVGIVELSVVMSTLKYEGHL